MRLINPIKHDGTFYPAGLYKGGLPSQIEAQFKDAGYFEISADSQSSSDPINPGDLNVKGIQKLKTVKAVIDAMETLNDEQLLELLEIEESSKKPRAGVKDAITKKLESE